MSSLRASPDEGIAPTVVGRLEWFYDRIERLQVATSTGNILERGERIMVSEFLTMEVLHVMKPRSGKRMQEPDQPRSHITPPTRS
jgi:hypothetical protein